MTSFMDSFIEIVKNSSNIRAKFASRIVTCKF